MQGDIADKNSKIAQLTMANVKLATRNSQLTEISTKNKPYKKERGTESEEEDEESEIRNGKRRAEERKGQRKRQRPNEQEKGGKIKCQWHEKGKCNRYECKFRHPRKVCKNYNQDYILIGWRSTETPSLSIHLLLLQNSLPLTHLMYQGQSHTILCIVQS